MSMRLPSVCLAVALTLGPARLLPAGDDFPIHAATAPTSQIFQVGGTSAFNCIADNLYRQFADLTLTFMLPAPTPVVILYKVSGTVDFGPGFMVTRVMVDGTEEPALRDITGDTAWFGNSGTWVRVLGAGSHTVTVEYRTVSGCINDPAGATHATRKLMAIAYTGP